MSFILEAIAKSEQERQQQEMPNARMLTLPAVPVQQRRRLLPFLVVIALLLNAIVIVIWMQSDGAKPEQVARVEPENMEPVIEQGAVSDIAKPANPATPNEAAADTGIPAGSPQTAKPVIVNESPAVSEITIPTTTAEMATGQVEEPETVPTEPVATEIDEEGAVWIRSDPDTLSNKTQAVPKVEPQEIQAPAEEKRKVFDVSELPSDVRRDLPTVTFSGHLYSVKPGVSVVFVDGGRPIREGRRIANELILHKITPTGVIVDFRGYLVEVGILQNWSLR
jgi:general secretion pathway protein B